MEDRRIARHDLPVLKKETTTPAPGEIVDAVKTLLLDPLTVALRAKFHETYSQSLSADDVASTSIEDIINDKRLQKRCESDESYTGVCDCVKILIKLVKEDKADYKKFMKKLDEKIWQKYLTLPLLKGQWQDFGSIRQKYWDSKKGKPRDLDEVSAKEASNSAPVALVKDVKTYVFNDFLDSLIGYNQDGFRKTKDFEALNLRTKFKTTHEFGLYIIDDETSDCYLAFRKYCQAKDEKTDGSKLVDKLDCVVLLNKALKIKDDYDGFMIILYQAYHDYFPAKKGLVSDDMRKAMKKCIDLFWDKDNSKPKPLSKAVKG